MFATAVKLLRTFAFVFAAWWVCTGVPLAAQPGEPSNVTELRRVSGDVEFVWRLSCGGEGCLSGTFIGGDFWVAPTLPGDAVVVHSVAPEGEENGMEINPQSRMKQGFLHCQAKSYDPSLNISTRYGFSVKPDSSLVKAARRKERCRTKAMNGCCVERYDVLTVLSAPPRDGGAQAFRPGFAGDEKRIYYLDELNLQAIPRDGRVPISTGEAYREAYARWYPPYVDHYMAELGDAGRAFAPHSHISDYGAEQAAAYLGDLLNIMSPDTLAHKRLAIVGLTQRGIDLYTSWQSGITWPSGAGQQLGRKPPITFFGALTENEAVVAKIRSLHGQGNETQEDGQIRSVAISQGGAGVPVWGDVNKRCDERTYWANLFRAKGYAGSAKAFDRKGDNVRTCGDPYGLIDGPAGMPGSAYMKCCSTGPYIAFAISQNLMPSLCHVANDRELLDYAQRVLEHGVHTQPDRCAPPDPRESDDCDPYRRGDGCIYYGKTWGPDPARRGSCIVNGTNGTGQSGRFPELHGKSIAPIYNEPLLSKRLRTQLGHEAFSGCVVR